VTLAFAAADESKVGFECLLDYAAAPGGPDKPAVAVRATYGAAGKQYARMPGAPGATPAPPLGAWAPCAGPLSLWGLSFGDWSLSVRASDAAGNASPPAVAKWATRYEPGKRYARVVGGAFGLVNTRALEFEVTAFDGADGGGPAPAGAAATLEWTFMKAGAPAVPEGTTWNAGASAAFKVPVDGEFVFLARPAGDATPVAGAWPDTWAVMPVTVDTAPPNVTVSQRPPALQSSPEVTVRFAVAPPGAADADFECRWLHADAAAPDPAADAPPFGPCAGEPAGDAAPGAATANVTEGFWLFQVRATDAAGNVGAPVDVAFRTDLTPPQLASIEFPNATNAGFVTVAFKLDDGPSGTGIANVSCRMALDANAAGADGEGAPAAGAPPAGAHQADGQWIPDCASPVRCAREGGWLWTQWAGPPPLGRLDLCSPSDPPPHRASQPPQPHPPTPPQLPAGQGRPLHVLADRRRRRRPAVRPQGLHRRARHGAAGDEDRLGRAGARCEAAEAGDH
jgi:hypothetical protein